MEASSPKPRRVLGALLKALKWTIGAVLLLIVLVYAINAFDEDLSPEAKALLMVPPNPYKPEDNLNLVLLGLDAPEGVSPVAAGEERLAALKKDLAEATKDPNHRWPDFYEQKRPKLEFQGKLDFCRPLTGSCLQGVAARKADIERLVKANRELVRRYSQLHDRQGYYDGIADIAFLPAFAPPGLRQLYLANVALQVKTGTRSQQAAALASLRDDIRTWRLMLTGEGSLISKMIAVANLQGDFALLADAIAERDFDLPAHASAVRAALEVMKEEDWKISGVQRYEFRFTANLLEQAKARGDSTWFGVDDEENRWWNNLLGRILLPLFKIKATENLLAKTTMRRIAVANADPAKLLAAQDTLRKWHEGNLGIGTGIVYNPVGKFILNDASDTYFNYSLRTYDCAALLRSVRLSYEIRNQKIGDKALPAFMGLHPEWASHPVDGRPFLWDDKKREIAVQTLGPQPKDRRFYIRVWSAARGARA